MNATSSFKKKRKKEREILITGKILKQNIKRMICKHSENNVLITRSQHGFDKDKSCQTNFISFFLKKKNWITASMNCGNAVKIINPSFSKAFDKVLTDKPISKLV